MDKVLLVIQNYTTLRTFSSFVNDDYQVECFKTESEVINAIESNQYVLIIIDFSPSKINGQTILNYLKDNHKFDDQPVIAILESQNVQMELDLFSAGISDFFIAPYDSILTKKRIQNLETVSHLKKNVAVFEQKLSTDPLTGLLNRDGFQASVRKQLKSNNEGAFLMCDLDGLKYINDNYSHQTGDLIIQGVGKVLKEVLADIAYVAHISGDEFCAFIKNTSSQEEISELCNKIQKNLLSKVLLPDLSRPTTVSIGIAVYPDIAKTYEDLQFKADHALLYVKNHGKNGYRFHNPRDDREELLKGRQECTNLNTNLMLKERAGEDIQTWLKFGEFRVLYISQNRFNANNNNKLYLLNILDKENPNCPDSKKINSLNESISTFIKDSQLSGVFSWFSINQLLILSTKPETFDMKFEKLIEVLTKEMEELHLSIELKK